MNETLNKIKATEDDRRAGNTECIGTVELPIKPITSILTNIPKYETEEERANSD